MCFVTVAKVIYLLATFRWDFTCGEPFNNQFVVRINGGPVIAQKVATEHGLNFVGQVGSLENLYLFEQLRLHKRLTETSHKLLQRDPAILWIARQEVKKRVKRDVPVQDPTKAYDHLSWKDPLYQQQWYMRKGGARGFDMNVEKAWRRGVSGKGISISILDDGLQYRHPDLLQNFDQLASLDINGRSLDPTPTDDGNNKHGTRCAGEIAAVAGNGICGVGVAFNASIGGVRMLDGEVTDHVEGAALSLNPQHVHAYSASWGPDDDGQTVDGPGPLARQAFENGVKYGRNGLGSLYIWASGNGGSNGDSCSCDGYASSIYTISVSSAAQDGTKPWYLEECPSTLTTTYSSGSMLQPAVVTTDLDTPGNNGQTCTINHTGTSASAPLATGIAALALEANPKLTWRDMQHLMILASNPTPLLDDWNVNALNRKVSNRFGYGLLDADKLVELATDWKTVGPQHICRITESLQPEFSSHNDLILDIPSDGCSSFKDKVGRLEHVQAVLTIEAHRRGNIVISLTSPMNTTSILLPRRALDQSTAGFVNWAFTSVQFWDENPSGMWQLRVEYQEMPSHITRNQPTNLHEEVFLRNWSLVLYGTKETLAMTQSAGGDVKSRPYKPTLNPSSCGMVERFSWMKSVILLFFPLWLVNLWHLQYFQYESMAP